MASLNCIKEVVEEVLMVTEELLLAVNVSLEELVVLQVPKSIVKEPAPTVAPVFEYVPETNV